MWPISTLPLYLQYKEPEAYGLTLVLFFTTLCIQIFALVYLLSYNHKLAPNSTL
jgi:hypothetical protein